MDGFVSWINRPYSSGAWKVKLGTEVLVLIVKACCYMIEWGQEDKRGMTLV